MKVTAISLDPEQQQKLPGGNHPSTLSLPYPYLRVVWYFVSRKMAAKDNSTIAAKPFGGRNKRSSGAEKFLRGLLPPSEDEG